MHRVPVKDADQKSASVLFERHGTGLLKYLKMICRNEHTAEDILQETFLRVYKSIESFDPLRGSFAAWSRTIARNLCIRHLNKKSVGNLHYDSETVEQAGDERESAGSELLREDIKKVIKKAVECLPETERGIVYGKYIDRLTLDEIADRMKISRRTVSRRYTGALKMLRDELLKLDPSFGEHMDL